MWVYSLLFIGQCFLSGALSSTLAAKKGYSGYFWTGFLLGIWGLIYVAGLPPEKLVITIPEKKAFTDPVLHPTSKSGFAP